MSYDNRIETQLGLLPEDWNIITLGDELYIKGRIGWKGLKKNEYLEKSNYRIINGSNIINNKIDWSNCGYISEERYDESPEIMLKSNDIVMTKDGTIGKVAKLGAVKEKTTVASGLFVIRNKSEIIDTDYLFYYFNSHYFKSLVKGRTEGSVIPHLYQRDFVSMQIPLPTRIEQKAIANILSSLDEKIEVNNQINKKLEEMAQSIFKQWFVDFEFPNEEGKPYKSSGGAMVESELGMIPEGWGVKQINDVVSVLSKGTTPTKKDIETAIDEPSVKFIKVKDIEDNGNILIDNIESIPRSVHLGKLKRSILKEWDILFSIAGTIGRVSFIDKRIEDSNSNQAIAFIRLKDSKQMFFFLYFLLKSSNVQNEIQSKVVQAVQANVSLGILKDLSFVVPNQTILNRYNEIISSLFNRIISIQNENGCIRMIRETILPKLMSGEIRVPVEKE